MTWLNNSWYQAAWADELEIGRPVSRMLLGEPILFYRRENGEVAALHDRCPHRFVPLSAGIICGDAVRCAYHGLAFGPNGHCVTNPHGAITSSMKVRSFPVVERYSGVWVWMGTPEDADPTNIPDLSYIHLVPETARIRMYIPTRANYQLLIDNIMDLSHADYIHPTSLGGMMTESMMRTRAEGDAIIVEWTADKCIPAPAFAPMVPLDGRIDVWVQVKWQPPAVMVLSFSAVPAGEARNPNVHALHNMVPETETSTHYFMYTTRSFELEDQGVTAALRASAEQAFCREDKPILEKQQERMGTAEFWSLKPVLLNVDVAAVKVRRKLESLVAAERGRESSLSADRLQEVVS